MEMLNNIWIALSTPNEEFVKWMSIPILFLIEIPLTMYIFIYALNIEANRKQKITFIVLMSLVAILSNFVIPSPYNVLFNYGMMILLILKIFNLNIFKSFLAMVIPISIIALTNVLLLKPFLAISNITYEQIMTIPSFRSLYLLFLYLVLLGIAKLFKHKSFAISVIDELDKTSKTILFINLAFGLTAIILQLFLTVYYINTLPIVITIISFISLLAYFGISIYSLTRVTKLALTTQKLESAEEYNKSLSILHDSVRGFKHDFDNIVATIGGYVKTDDLDGLKKYYSELESDCQKVNNIATLNPNIINNPGIFNLLSTKYHDANNKNIKINLEYFLDLNTLNMKIYEFSRILGILIDNAIDEAEKCNIKLINLKFRNEFNNNRQVIIIENTYSNKDVDTEKIFNKGVSGKKEHSGFGLWEVRKIIKKSKNINLHTSKDENLFKQQLEIYNI